MTDLIERGYELLADGKVNRAFACFGKEGRKSARGYLEIARCYSDGVGVEENWRLAKKYFWLAVRQAKRIHERKIRTFRRRPKNRMFCGRSEMRRHAKVRDWLAVA